MLYVNDMTFSLLTHNSKEHFSHVQMNRLFKCYCFVETIIVLRIFESMQIMIQHQQIDRFIS